MQRIALFMPELECGGAQRLMLLLAREFMFRGFAVDVVVAQARGALVSEIPAGARLVNLQAKEGVWGRVGVGFGSVRGLSEYIKKAMPEVMLSTITGANVVAVVARFISNVSMRLVLREAVSLQNRNSRFWRLMMRLLYPKADGVVVLSEVMFKEMADIIGVAKSKIHCIGNVVDVGVLKECAEEPIDDYWKDEIQPSFILAVGRLTAQKDYETLIRAFSQTNSKSSTSLVILGEGPKRPELEALVSHLNLEDCVHLLGHENNPWRWMVRARLFVLSSRWEGHPNALIEAMALGVPVVTTLYDKSATNVVNRRGSVVPVGDPKNLAMAIDSILKNTDNIEMSVSETDSVEKAVDSYLDVLDMKRRIS